MTTSSLTRDGSLSERLATFAAAVDFDALPAAVIGTLKLHLLDTLGVAVAAAPRDFGIAALATIRAFGGPPTCTVIAAEDRLPAAWAALANGTLAHGLDFDNTHQESVVHVSAGIVPAALAACEEAGADGRALLVSLAVGQEASIRIGLAARGGFHDRGFHPTGICNAFGAALAAGRVRGLDADRLADALGIAGSQAAGSLEFLTDGTWVKRLHGGWAAHAGLVAAALAGGGFTGPRGVLDGRFGLYRSHLGAAAWDATAVTQGLGDRWELRQTGLKPYPCCHYNHAFIDCAAAIRARYAVDPATISHITCLIAAREIPIVCEPAATKQRPQTDYDAKFSLPYAVACMLSRGQVDIDDFTPAAISDFGVLDLAARTTYEVDAEAEFPRRFGGRLRVHLRDGRVLEHHEPVNRGSAERPLTEAEVIEKFRRNASRSLPPERIDAVIDAVASIERQVDLSALARSLRG
jgi:2-methylcitrate dehydratase PrpD